MKRSAAPKRGERRGYKRGGIVTAGSAALGALKSLGEQGPDLVACAKLASKWEAIVGSNLAHHLRPVQIANHVVTIEASSEGWLSEARFLEEALLTNMAREVPRMRFEEVRFRLARKGKEPYLDRAIPGASRSSSKAAREPALAPGPVPAEVEKEIDRIVGRLEDESLRESLRRVFRLAHRAEAGRPR